jgi:hypothetical protein
LNHFLDPFASRFSGALEILFQLVHREVYMIGVGFGLFGIAVGHWIETGQNGPAAIEIVPPI